MPRRKTSPRPTPAARLHAGTDALSEWETAERQRRLDELLVKVRDRLHKEAMEKRLHA